MAKGPLYLSQDSQACLLSLELQKGKKKHKPKKNKNKRGALQNVYIR